MPSHASNHFNQEKRRHPRLDSKIPVKISGDLGEFLTETKNLSCSGAFFRVPHRLEPMTKLKVHLLLPLRKSDKVTSKKISCQGIIVRVQACDDGNAYDMAIFFSDIAPKDAQVISEFVEGMLEKKDGEFN